MSTDTRPAEKLAELTRDLSTHSKDDARVVQLLQERACVYEELNKLDLARADLQTAIQRDPSNQQAKDAMQRLYTLSSSPSEAAGTSASSAKTDEDPLTGRFQGYLRQVSGADNAAWIRSFVKSTDFVDVLAACGGRPETMSAHARSTAYMILTKLFNPAPEAQAKYPMQLIIETCAQCFSRCVDSGKNAEKLLAYRTLNAIFETGMTVGAAILSQEGVVEEMMDVIDFEVVAVQTAMVEVLAIACADKTCHKLIVKYASQWLAFTATRGKDARLKALASTTLSKLQTHQRYQEQQQPQQQQAGGGGSNNNDQQDSALEDAMNKMNLGSADLTDSMLATVKNFKTQDAGMILNAVEGLAYATLQADVKETVANDPVVLKSLATIVINTTSGGGDAAAANHPLLFGIGTILRNVTMYKPVLDEQQKQMKRLRDLANARSKGAAASSDADDPRESDAAVEKRVAAAVESGAALALLVLAKAGSSTSNGSSNLRMVAAQTYLNLVTPQAMRGKLLQQGVAKGLLMLVNAHDDNELVAAQALARLAITADPRLAFGTAASLDLVRPFLGLCRADGQALRQFEGLMALTNLASVDDAVRLKIHSEGGMSAFEGLQLASNVLVQRAATEMVCNMTFCDPVFEAYSNNANRLRLLMVFSDHEDAPTRCAASGALAILANSPDACKHMAQVDKAFERLTRLVDPKEPADVQHRGVEIIRLMLQHLGKEAAQAFAAEHAHTHLAAIVKSCNVNVVRSAAMEVLKMFVTNGIQLK